MPLGQLASYVNGKTGSFWLLTADRPSVTGTVIDIGNDFVLVRLSRSNTLAAIPFSAIGFFAVDN